MWPEYRGPLSRQCRLHFHRDSSLNIIDKHVLVSQDKFSDGMDSMNLNYANNQGLIRNKIFLYCKYRVKGDQMSQLKIPSFSVFYCLKICNALPLPLLKKVTFPVTHYCQTLYLFRWWFVTWPIYGLKGIWNLG